MIRKLLLSALIFLFAQSQLQAQITVSNITTAGRFSTCSAALGTPLITCNYVSGPGSHVSGGVLICDNPCDSTILDFNVSNIRWNQNPGINWLHGVFFPNAAGITLTGNNLGAGWGPYATCTGATCSAQVNGTLGYYYDGVNTQSCCPGNPANDGNPGNNFGVGTIDCNSPTTGFQISFRLRICNTAIISNQYFFKLRGTADGGTGCWATPDAVTHTIVWAIATQTCGPTFTTNPAAGPIGKTCTPAPDYTVSYTAACGNSSTVTWWTQLVGGTQVGSGSPFVYHSTTCPSNNTLYASCCPNTAGTCVGRYPASASMTCPTTLALNPVAVTQPDCANPNAGAGSTTATAGTSSGTVTYTLTPGGTSNTTGSFGPGLAPGGYTITAVDGTGCSASVNFTINTPATGGPGPTVTSPVSYCQNQAASPLAASGTNILYYTVATGGAGVSTYTPSTATVGTFTYYASQNPTGACESSRTPITVNVTANTTITLSSGAGTNNQTVCVNVVMTPITFSTANGVTGASATGLPTGITLTYSGGTDGTVTLGGTPTTNGVFNYTISTSGGCGIATATGTITVSTAATITLSSAAGTNTQTVCVNTGITSITYSVGGGATGATVTGPLPAGVTGVYSGSTFTISGTPSATGNFPYSVTTTGGCGSVTLSGSITVNQNTTITLTSAAGTNNQTPCVNTAITPITYSVGGGGTGGSVIGLPAGVTGTYGGGVITISGTPTATGTFNYTVSTTGTCITPTAAGTITVGTLATMTLSSAPSTTSQAVCPATAITPITYSVGGGATGATVTALPTGITGTYSGGTFTISGTPSGPAGTTNYTVSTTGGCGIVNLTGSITVNPNMTVTLTSGPATQTVCINTPITGVTYSTANGVTNVTASGLPAGLNAVYSGGTNGTFTISGNPTASGTFNYTVTATGGCGTATATGTITVNPNVTMTLTSGAGSNNQTVNINTPITNITYGTGSGATGATVVGLPAGVTGTYSGTTFTISGTPTVAGTFNYAVTTTGGCSLISLTGTIIVNDLVTLALSSAAGTNNQTVCINTPITQITYAAGGGATGVALTSGSFPAGVTGSYGGGTNGTYTINGTPTIAGTFPYTLTTSGGTGTASQSGSITVNPNATIVLTSPAATANQTLCIGVPIANIVYTTGSGATGVTLGGTLPAGVSGTYAGNTYTISGTPAASGTFNYTVTTSGGCSNAMLGGSIVVNPNATILLTSGAATANQTVCINIPIASIVYTTGSGATGVTLSGTLPAGVTGIYSGNTYTISGMPTASGTFNYTVKTSGGCSNAMLSGTIIVNPNVTMTLTSPAATAAQTVCINGPLTNIVYTTTNGATGATMTGLPAGVTGTFSGNTYTINGNPSVAGNYIYTVTTTGGCGSVTLNGTMTVNPAATIVLASAASTTNQTICINSGVTNIVYTIGNGATGVTAAGLPPGVTGSLSGNTYTISGNATTANNYNYTVTTTGGCGMAQLSGTILVNPNVTLTLTSASANQTDCINQPMTSSIIYTAANGATGATVTGLPPGVSFTYSGGTITISGTPTTANAYNYTVTTTGGCSTASLSGTITVNPAATISLTSPASTAAQTVCINTMITNIVYTTANGATGATVTGLPTGVTGTYSGNTYTISGTPSVAGTFSYTVSTTGGCGTAPISGTITVNPNVTLTIGPAPGNQTVCINVAMTAITYTTGNGATGATVTGLPTGVNGTYSGNTLTISGTPTVTGTFTYNVTTTGGCSSASLGGTIIVSPNVTMTLTSAATTTSQTICINAPLTSIVYTTGNGATGASVTGLPTGVSGTYSGGTNGTFTITGNPNISGGPFNYTVTTTGGCSSASLGGTINVNPAATITLSSAASTTNQTICINTPITTITYTTANGATGATVTGLPPGVTGSYSAGTFTINGIATAANTYNYTVSTTGGCGTATQTGTIIVNPDVTMTLTSASPNQTLCINTPMTAIVYTTGNGATGVTANNLPAGVNGTFSGNTFTIDGTPTVAGTYVYTVKTTGGCNFVQLGGTITVNANVTLTLTSSSASANQTICNNTAATNIIYTTSNGATGATVTGLPTGITGTYSGNTFTISGTATVPGSYSYMVTSTGGCSSASLGGTIEVIAIPAAPTVVSPVTYCPNDAATPLTATGTNLLWYTTAAGGVGSSNAPTPSTAVSGSSTDYYVSQSTTIGSCEGPRAMITVNVKNSLSVVIGNDTTICQGDTLALNPTVNPAANSYLWRSITPNVPNSTISSLITLSTKVFPVDTAEYELSAVKGGCASKDTIKVNVRWKPIVDAGPNVAICLNDSTLLKGIVTHTSPANAIMSYSWTPTDSLTTPNAVQTYAHPTRSTWYRFTDSTTVADYGCAFVAYDSVKVVVQPVIHANAGQDTIAAKNTLFQLYGHGGINYLWSSPTPGVLINNPTGNPATVTLTADANFFLEVRDAVGCVGYDSVFVKVYEGPTYYVPNAFSPNGDGLNDVFRAIPPGIATTVYFRVFNRYGELVFETNQWLKGWDGTYKGTDAPMGVYVWTVKGVDRNNYPIEMKGTVTLVR